MSAQLVLTDLEMEALQRCVILAAAEPDEDEALTDEQANAALRAYRKFTPHLNRKSRRRPK